MSSPLRSSRSTAKCVSRCPLTIAVPGRLTSAHLALRLLEPNVDARYVRFDEVIDYVREGHADAGVIIHEGQLTYRDADLQLVLDLGEWWHDETGLPLPLGGNVARIYGLG